MPDQAAQIAQAFARVPLFAGLSRRKLADVAKRARTFTHKAGSEIASQGRNGLAFHVVADGEALVQVGGVARRTLYPGDYFGEISMIDGQPRSATVVAGDEGLVTYALNRTEFRSIVDADPEVARAIMVALCARIRAAELAH